MSKRVLIFAPYAQFDVHLQVDVIWGKALQLRDCEILVVRCDAQYPNCLIDRTGKHSHCTSCIEFGNRFFGRFELPQRFLSDLLMQQDRTELVAWEALLDEEEVSAATFRDVPVGALVATSVLTQLRTDVAGLAQPAARTLHRSYALDAAKTYLALKNAVATFAPDVVITFNGRFYPQRVACTIAREHGITFFCHERGQLPNTFSFFRNVTVDDVEPLRAIYRLWQDAPLTRSELETMDGLFSTRRSGRPMNYPSFYDDTQSRDSVLQQLGIPPNAKLIGVFTSSRDEGQLCEEYHAIEHQTEFLRHIAEYCRGREVYCVVRHHPHIGDVLGVPETGHLVELLLQSIDAPPNMRIIMPWENIRSYDLFPHLDCALAPFSTIAVELTAYGIDTGVLNGLPNAAPLRAPLADLSYGEVARFLDRSLTGTGQDPVDRRQTYRYAYAFYARRSVELRSISIRDHFYSQFNLESDDELRPGIDPALDHVCDMVLNDAPAFPTPPESIPAAAVELESAFLLDSLPKRPAKTEPTPLPAYGRVLVLGGHTAGDALPFTRWVRRSRYTDVIEVSTDLDFDDQSTGGPSRALTALRAADESDYIVLSGTGTYLDESFLLRAAQLLRNAGQDVEFVNADRIVVARNERLLRMSALYRTVREDCSLLADPVVLHSILSGLMIRRDRLPTLFEGCGTWRDVGYSLVDQTIHEGRHRVVQGTSLLIA